VYMPLCALEEEEEEERSRNLSNPSSKDRPVDAPPGSKAPHLEHATAFCGSLDRDADHDHGEIVVILSLKFFLGNKSFLSLPSSRLLGTEAILKFGAFFTQWE
jgi:hypothetical protein